jgi:hypothetical protein
MASKSRGRDLFPRLRRLFVAVASCCLCSYSLAQTIQDCPNTMPHRAKINADSPHLPPGPLQVFNVVDMGADPSGNTDSAAAFRAAFGNNRTILVPVGHYLFGSTEASPCCAFDRTGVLVSKLSNFRLRGEGATIIVSQQISLSSAFHIHQSHHFSVSGLTIIGSRTGLSAAQENAGLAFSSDTDFVVKGIHLAGDFGGNGAAIVGDWLVDGKFEDISADRVGHCMDLAYLLRIRISRIQARGAGAGGNGTAGQTCISVIPDPPNAGKNQTMLQFNASSEITITDIDESNFNTGALLSAGHGYTLSHNHWHDNRGNRPGLGIGVWIKQGTAPENGVQPSDVEILCDRFTDNGRDIVGDRGRAGVVAGRSQSDTWRYTR